MTAAEPTKCANCGEPLGPPAENQARTHHNGILFCAFVTPQINWDDQRTARDPLENQDQPPEVDVHDDRRQLPPAVAAAERVREFVGWFGDGQIWHAESDDTPPPLYARDLEALARAVESLETLVPHAKAQALREAADELAKLPYVRPDHPDRAEYERLLAVRRGNTDRWLRDRAEGIRNQ